MKYNGTIEETILFVIVVFADNFHVVGNKIYRVKPNTKLTNKVKITTGLHLLHKSYIQEQKTLLDN